MPSHLRFSYHTVLLAQLLVFSAPIHAQTATEAWVRRYSSGEAASRDSALKLVVDPGGNAVIAGWTDDRISTAADMLIVKYSGAGVPLWTNRYNGPGNDRDFATGLAVDNTGNVFVTGSSSGIDGHSDYATIAYSEAGVPLWTNRFSGGSDSNDSANAIAVDNSGNVFVTGTRGDSDYATIAYSTAGVALWTNYYDGPGNNRDFPTALATDQNGNVFVTGYSFGRVSSDYATIAYSRAGVALWTNRYNGQGDLEDYAAALAVDQSGNLFVTGGSQGSLSRYDYLTIAYSTAGVALWTNLYAGPANRDDAATAVAVNSNGTLIVTGSSRGSGSSFDYVTIAYSGAGVALWTNRYNGQAGIDDFATAMAVDHSGNVFVTGYSHGSLHNFDYATIAYSTAGLPLWTNRYNGVAFSFDRANAVAVDTAGNVFVTGSSGTDAATIGYSGAGVALWTNRYNGLGNEDDRATAAVADNCGNVFVTGSSFGRTSSDYATIAYSGAGIALWTNRYNGLGNGSDFATALAVDDHGNIFVTGYSQASAYTYDYATIAYSTAGVPLWTNCYRPNSGGRASAIAVRGSGVFVTGSSANGINFDYATIAYSTAGVALWTNCYDGRDVDDFATALAADQTGNLFVTGYSGSGGSFDYVTIAYSGAGVALWTNRYNGPDNNDDRPNALASGTSGHLFVTGYSYVHASNYDYATIAYSGAGVALWTNRYNGPANGVDQASAVAADASGTVFITGHSSGGGSGFDYATLAYSSTGAALWTNRYNGPGDFDDFATAVATDQSGNVFVTGYSGRGGSFDYVTIAYSGAGVALWTNRYNGPANGDDRPGAAFCLAVAPNGAVYLTGSSDGNAHDGTVYDYATIKYVWTSHLAIQPLITGSPTVHLTLSGPPNSSWSVERGLTIAGPWTNLGSWLIGTDGHIFLQDATPPSKGAFYRAASPP